MPDLAAELQVDDLRRAGWRIVGPRREADGLTWVRASHPFSTPAGARRVIAQLTGPGGPFRGFALTHTGSPVPLACPLHGHRRPRDRPRGVRRCRARAPAGCRQPRCRRGDVEATLRGRPRAAAEGGGDGAAPGAGAHVAATRGWRAGAPGRGVESWDVRALGLVAVGGLALVLGITTSLVARRRRRARPTSEPTVTI